MKQQSRSIRNWWKVPRRISEREEERRVTFLELFYDLVYVVIIAELAHALSQNTDLAGIGNFIFLFVIVWWAWLNGILYHDLHGQNDVRTISQDSFTGYCDGLQTTRAETIDGLSGDLYRQSCHQRDHPGYIEPLRSFRIGTAKNHIIDQGWIKLPVRLL